MRLIKAGGLFVAGLVLMPLALYLMFRGQDQDKYGFSFTDDDIFNDLKGGQGDDVSRTRYPRRPNTGDGEPPFFVDTSGH